MVMLVVIQISTAWNLYFTLMSLPQAGINVEIAGELCKRLYKQKGPQILLDS